MKYFPILTSLIISRSKISNLMKLKLKKKITSSFFKHTLLVFTPNLIRFLGQRSPNLPNPFGQSDFVFRQFRRRLRLGDAQGDLQLDRRVLQRHREGQVRRSGSDHFSGNDELVWTNHMIEHFIAKWAKCELTDHLKIQLNFYFEYPYYLPTSVAFIFTLTCSNFVFVSYSYKFVVFIHYN